MQLTRTVAALFRIIASACVATAILLVPTNATAQGTKVKFGYFPAMVDTPVFIAASQGIFAKNGLDVEMILFTSGPALIGSLLSGSTPVVDVGALLTFQQVAKGHDIRGLSHYWSSNFYSLIARSDLATPNAGKPYPAPILDLKGKKLGVVALGSATAAFAETILKDAGLQPGTDVTIVPAGAIATAAATLVSGGIDAYISYAPMNQLLDARNPGSYKLLVAPEQFPAAIQVNLYPHAATTQKYISANPLVADAICKSIEQSLAFLADPNNFDAAVVGLEKWLPGNPPGVIAAALKVSLPQILGDRKRLGKITPEQVKNASDQMLAIGYTSQAVTYDPYVYRSSTCN